MSIADELARLAKLRDDGSLSEAEFQQQKTKLLHPKGATRNAPKGMGRVATAILWIGGAFVVFIVYGAIVGNTPESKEKSAARLAISMCQEPVNDTLLELSTRRLHRDACNTMIQRFKQRYGHNP